MRKMWLAALFSALAATSVDVADAEVVELRSGERVEGKLQQATSTSVSIEVAGRVLTFPADQVRSVHYGPVPMVSLKPGPNAARDGLTALQGLRTKLGDGVSYREYEALLNDVKPTIERVAHDGTVSAGVRLALEKALGYYTTAASVWAKSLQNNAGLIDDAVLASLQRDQCAGLRALQSRDRGFVLQAMWTCAGESVEQTEKLVR